MILITILLIPPMAGREHGAPQGADWQADGQKQDALPCRGVRLHLHPYLPLGPDRVDPVQQKQGFFLY